MGIPRLEENRHVVGLETRKFCGNLSSEKVRGLCFMFWNEKKSNMLSMRSVHVFDFLLYDNLVNHINWTCEMFLDHDRTGRFGMKHVLCVDGHKDGDISMF